MHGITHYLHISSRRNTGRLRPSWMKSRRSTWSNEYAVPARFLISHMTDLRQTCKSGVAWPHILFLSFFKFYFISLFFGFFNVCYCSSSLCCRYHLGLIDQLLVNARCQCSLISRIMLHGQSILYAAISRTTCDGSGVMVLVVVGGDIVRRRTGVQLDNILSCVQGI